MPQYQCRQPHSEAIRDVTANDLHDAAQLFAEWCDREKDRAMNEVDLHVTKSRFVFVRPGVKCGSPHWTRFEVKAAREIVYRASVKPSEGG